MSDSKLMYKMIAGFYDLLDVIYFTNHGRNPRKAINKLIQDKDGKILDLCCGTLGNSIKIAQKRPDAQIIGLDLSEDMLQIARKKIRKLCLANISVQCGDATNTGFADHTFDYVIIGLVLHETEEKLAEQFLQESARVLKEDGRLIVLEWECSRSIWKRLLFFPIKHMEPKPFKKFYSMNKKAYFQRNGFRVRKCIHCDYTCVYELEVGQPAISYSN